MFDDAEGFFGLEEAVGVDIVRHGDTIQFVAAVDSANEESDEFAGFDDLPTVTEVDSTHEANSVVPVDGVDDEEEVMEAGDEESALEAGVFAQAAEIDNDIEQAPNNATASAILVATDVAARGLDIAGIDLVIHYHVPRAADAYVHRSGRTARAESRGISILLCAPEEVVPTRRLIAKVHAAAQAKAGGQSSHLRERSGASDEGYFIQTADIDRRIVSRLKERVVLAKKIADAELAREKGKKEGDWVREAAEALGVEYDSDEMESVGKWAGRGSARKRKEQEARELTKADVSLLKAQLRELLSIRVNTGVSEKYLSGLDVDRLLKGEKGEFLGSVPSLGLDDL
ncbi:hypothetical protein P8C59_008678 [Phyllachora maydis]|uniref:RNA helicase n=1 Tax=Phyllachora maydis TaxID=1825666 RepID=A0AAD9IBL3_9PEZI|nr:hypothetical protein P8C59_008678 [Phyllachora maydis]